MLFSKSTGVLLPGFPRCWLRCHSIGEAVSGPPFTIPQALHPRWIPRGTSTSFISFTFLHSTYHHLNHFTSFICLVSASPPPLKTVRPSVFPWYFFIHFGGLSTLYLLNSLLDWCDLPISLFLNLTPRCQNLSSHHSIVKMKEPRPAHSAASHLSPAGHHLRPVR